MAASCGPPWTASGPGPRHLSLPSSRPTTAPKPTPAQSPSLSFALQAAASGWIFLFVFVRHGRTSAPCRDRVFLFFIIISPVLPHFFFISPVLTRPLHHGLWGLAGRQGQAEGERERDTTAAEAPCGPGGGGGRRGGGELHPAPSLTLHFPVAGTCLAGLCFVSASFTPGIKIASRRPPGCRGTATRWPLAGQCKFQIRVM